jgi:CelD/BcsL family acetyltransferase involved in cellulose biosynthesis
MDHALIARAPLGFAASAPALKLYSPLAGQLPVEGRLSLVTTLPSLARLEPQWRALQHQDMSHASVFQSFEWVSSWAKVYAADNEATELCVVAGHVGKRLAFVLPLMKVRHAGLGIVKWLSEPFGQYGDILLAQGENAERWMATAFKLLSEQKGVDVIRLRHVREDAGSHAALTQLMIDARADDGAPVLDLTAYPDEAAYDARYTQQQRKRRKKIRKSLEAHGALQFDTLEAGAESDASIVDAIDEKNKWLDARGRHNRVLKCPAHVAFLQQLTRASSSDFRCSVSALSAGGKAVSWEVGFDYRGTHYGYITSHRTELTDLSPGRLHMDLSQRQALKQGMARFDLMVPNDVHKESWSSRAVRTQDFYLPVSTLGHAFGIAYLRGARPLLRRAYYASPIWLLRAVNNAAARFMAAS